MIQQFHTALTQKWKWHIFPPFSWWKKVFISFMFFPALISLYGLKTWQTAFKITLFQELNRCWCKNTERQDWISECEKDRDEWRRWGSKKFFSLMGCQNHFSVMSPSTLDGSDTRTHMVWWHSRLSFWSSLVGQWAQTEEEARSKKINHDDFLITGLAITLSKE